MTGLNTHTIGSQPVIQRPTIAIVAPVLNEESAIADLIASLTAQTEPAESILVVDGGSIDRTPETARRGGANVLAAAQTGRGNQIAEGLLQISEEVVLIAHADMRFSREALTKVRDSLVANPMSPGGCLGHVFDSSRLIYRWIEWFDERRARRGISYGDQAQFFRRATIERCGFPSLPIMEDLELSKRLLRFGPPIYVDSPVTVSPRRYEERGFLKTSLQNWRFRIAFARDGEAACHRLYQAYYASQNTRDPP
jgi:glycosyltransferase involved in cell wall biosynthesis